MQEANKKRFFVILFSLIAIFLILAFYAFYFNKKSKNFRIIFFDVGQGDSTFINFRNKEKMLVDCGLGKGVLSKIGKYLPFYDKVIDYLVVTHPDADHYSGCPAVLHRYHVKNIITNGEDKPADKYWDAWMKSIANEKANQIVISKRMELSIGGTRIEFLSPDEGLVFEEGKNSGNNKSIVFNMKDDSGDYLFVGDAETPLENAMASFYCASSTPCGVLDADFLKVGHHGSDTSSGEGFLDVISPDKAIISVGYNTFGHPSLRVLRKLERVGAEVWRTDEKGDIIIEEGKEKFKKNLF
jgi:competence protein ComEC